MLRLTLVALLLAPAVGADNLLYNGDFELASNDSPPPGWSMWGAQQWKNPANYTRDTTNPHGGRACFRIHHPAKTAGYIVSAPEKAIRPVEGMTYTASFWARSDPPTDASFGWTCYESIHPYRDAPSPGFQTIKVTADWQRFSVTITEGMDFFAGRSKYLMLTFFATRRNELAATLWLDDITVTAEPNAGGLRLVDESALTDDPLPQPLGQGDTLNVEVDTARTLRPATRQVGGISFHRVVGWTGQPYDKEGKYTLHPELESAIRDLKLPMTRFYGVGHEPFGLEASLDKVAELGRKLGIPLEWVVIELEEQSANRLVTPADWARAARHSLAKGYGFRYWEVANEPSSGTWGRQMGKAFESAEAYADHVKAVSAAVKAVQPGAQIGIAVAESLKWGNLLLARAAGSYDFVVHHYYSGFGGGDRKYEAVTLTDNYQILDRVLRVGALIRHYNPNREVYQLDTEWGLHSGGPNGERADDVRRNANSWGMVHRAVRMIHYAREGLLRGAGSWQMLNFSSHPGFGILAQDKPQQRFLMYWLYWLFNRHVGAGVLAISGTAPYYTPAAGDDARAQPGRFGGPATPVLATADPDGTVYLVLANGYLDRQVPCTITLRGARAGAIEATLLRQADAGREAEPLLARREDAVSALPVERRGETLSFALPAHAVAFIACR